jgi:prepilin-type N-terminal cleavage/methylation domain-containing protein
MTRRGVTLVELLVALALLGLMVSFVAYSGATRMGVVRLSPAADSIVVARHHAIGTGRAVVKMIWIDSAPFTFAAHPDGRIVSRHAQIDMLTGRWNASVR